MSLVVATRTIPGVVVALAAVVTTVAVGIAAATRGLRISTRP
jgi:hypothetical protein